MAQPPAYQRQFNWTQFRADFPFDPLPGDKLDLELNAVKATQDAIRTNLELIQRDDGEIENRTIGREQLKTEVLTQFGLLTPTRIKEFVYDIPAAVNESQQIAPNLTDFADASLGGGGSGNGFDTEFSYAAVTYTLTEALRQTTSVAGIQAAIELAIPALAGNIAITTSSGNPTSVVPWKDTAVPVETLFVEFINALANTNASPILLTFFDPGTAVVIAESPFTATTIQTGGTAAQQILTGADRNGDVLAYVIGAQISLHINGVKTDPANITAANGTRIVHSIAFSTADVITLEIGEAEFVPTTDIEKLDDITGLFNGVATVFPLTVGAQPRIANLAARLDVYIDFGDNHGATIQEPGVDFTVSGSDITFAVAPSGTAIFWATLRTLFAFGNNSILNQYYAPLSITGDKIANGTIGAEKLDFTISQIPIAGGVDYYDNVIGSDIPANTMFFPVGQTVGKCGSGADIEDDFIQAFFDKIKKRWGNLGTEDFDNLDVALIPDMRGTSIVVPDKGKLKVLTFSSIGNQSGLEILPNRVLCGTAHSSGFTNNHNLTPTQQGDLLFDFRFPGIGEGGSAPRLEAASVNGIPVGRGVGLAVVPLRNTATGHRHFIFELPLDHTDLRTCADRIMHPYTVVEKLIRIK